MAIKKIKPVGNGRRGTSYVDNSALSKTKGPKALKTILKKKAGRNNSGKITVAHRGGGSKRFYRLVNFDFNSGFKAKVVAIAAHVGQGIAARGILCRHPHKAGSAGLSAY